MSTKDPAESSSSAVEKHHHHQPTPEITPAEAAKPKTSPKPGNIVIPPPQGTEEKSESDESEKGEQNENDAVFVTQPPTPVDETGRKKFETPTPVDETGKKKSEPQSDKKDDSTKSVTEITTITETTETSMIKSVGDDFDRLDNGHDTIGNKKVESMDDSMILKSISSSVGEDFDKLDDRHFANGDNEGGNVGDSMLISVSSSTFEDIERLDDEGESNSDEEKPLLNFEVDLNDDEDVYEYTEGGSPHERSIANFFSVYKKQLFSGIFLLSAVVAVVLFVRKK